MGQNVKNCEGSETLTHLQANKLRCPNFLDRDRRHETPESEMKDGMSVRNSHSREPALAPVLPAPFPQRDPKRTKWHFHKYWENKQTLFSKTAPYTNILKKGHLEQRQRVPLLRRQEGTQKAHGKYPPNVIVSYSEREPPWGHFMSSCKKTTRCPGDPGKPGAREEIH